MDALSQQLMTGVIFTLVGFILGWYITRGGRTDGPTATHPSRKAALLALVDEIRATADGQQELWDDLRELFTQPQSPTRNEIRAHRQANRCYGQLMKSYRDQIFLQDPDCRVVPRRLAENVIESERDADGLMLTLHKMETDRQPAEIANMLNRLARLEQSNQSLQNELHVAREQIARQSVKLESAENEALQDHLTELPNRRAFEHRLLEIHAGRLRYGRSYSLLMLDLDHFKQINDTHGHLAGDAVLRLASRLMKETCRTADHVARYGGEEFAIITPDTELPGATRLAERLCERFRHASLIHDGKTLHFTCSIGVAESDANQTTAQLIAAADAALYAAKQSGRDTFRKAEPAARRPRDAVM